MSKEEAIKICEQVAEDVERDAKEFDGQPFTGKTIGTYLGYPSSGRGCRKGC